LFGDEYIQRIRDAPPNAKNELRELGFEIIFGRMWNRPGADHKIRILCSISALVVMGLDKHLGQYIKGALNVGVEPDTIKEIIMMLSFYGGFPNSLKALIVFDELVTNKRTG
jgi:3-oxoadipate enol-lactonase/4-carboxymuconolactone decarboxylase